MKKCAYCGAVLDEEAKFCEFCGAKQQEAVFEQTQKTPQQVYQPSQGYQPQQSQGYQPQQFPQQNPFDPANRIWGMGWFKFLINFWLFFMAFIYFFSSISCFTGILRDDTIYATTAAKFYFLYPEMEVVDIIYGVLQLLLIPFAVIVRIKLANYNKIGPTLFFAFIIADAIVDCFFYMFSLISVDTLYIIDMAFAIIWATVVILSFRVYFKNRSHFFIN